MKGRLLKSASNNLMAASEVLEELKSLDIKSRRRAKASAKKHWTKRIKSITKTLALLATAKRNVRELPRRVA